MIDTIKLIYPVTQASVYVAQSFAEHLRYAGYNGLCASPRTGAACPNGYYYPGIDYAPSVSGLDLSIYAAAGGTVTRVGYDKSNTASTGYGFHVRIMHGGGVETIYGHLVENSALVYPNERVGIGKVLGRMGGTGNCRPPGFVHLHFELRVNGIPKNPMPYFTASAGEPPAWTPPPVVEQPAPDEAWPALPVPLKMTWKVINMTGVNLRKGPTTQSPILGRLKLDEVFNSTHETAGEGGIWVLHPSGAWVCLVLGADIYLQAIQE